MAPHRLHLPFVSSEVEDLLLWRKWEKSAVVVGVGTALYIFLEWSGISAISALANILLLTIVVAFVWNNVATFAGRPTLPVPDIIKNGVKDSDVKAFADQATVYINKGLVAALLYFVARISNFFTSLGLLYTGFILAFTIPKIYELKKPEIDNALGKVKDQVNKVYDKHVKPAFDKIPRSSGTASKPASDIPTPQRFAAEVENAADRAKTS